MEGNLVLPVYFVGDESEPIDTIDDLNLGLASLIDTLWQLPIVLDKVRLGIVGIGGGVRSRRDMSAFSSWGPVPEFSAQGATSYAAAFEELRSLICVDVKRFKSDGNLVYRPLVLFVARNPPTAHDQWGRSYVELTDKNWPLRPNIIAVAIAPAAGRIVKDIATKQGLGIVASGGEIGRIFENYLECLGG